jgi:hypothetical protein
MEMTGMVLVVWGFALWVLLGLGALLIWTLRKGGGTAEAVPRSEEASQPVTDTLLLYYEEESVRRTPQGDLVLRIPGMAWEREWQEDLVRLDVTRLDPRSVEAAEEWGEAQVLAAYELRAHRMTEIGSDIIVESFAAPVDVFLVSESEVEGLRFGVKDETGWTLAPPAALPLDVLAQAGIPAGQGWTAASISRLRRVCLVRMPSE